MSTNAGAAGLGFSLDARERLLSEAERIARMGSFAWDVPSGTIHWSDELFRIFGLDPATTTPTVGTFFGAIHSEDVARVQAVAARGVETGVAEPVDFRVVRADGTIRHVSMNGAALFDEANQPTRFVGTLVDVTERVLVEDQLRRRELILRHAQHVAHVGSFEWNTKTSEVRWSEELRCIAGVPLERTNAYGLFGELVHPDDREAYERLRERAREGDFSAPMLECRIVRSEGTIRHVRIRTSPFSGERGEPFGVVGTVHDITELRELEAQLLQSQKMDALGRLAGGIAHDFNNLLTVMGLHLARLRRDADNADLVAIDRSVDHAAALTRQLLAFSRQSVLTTRAVDLNALVLDAWRMVDRIFDEHVTLRFDPCAHEVLAEGDPAQLTQVLMNLVLNARDAMPRGGTIEVRVSTATTSRPIATVGSSLHPGDYVVLEVRDDGIGMDATVRSRIFEPFFSTKEPGRGTGLGLSMVFGIVAQLHGGITVESEPREGTTIAVYLPRSRRTLTTKSELPRGPTRGSGERILLVEDEAPLRNVLAEVLVEAGFVVEAASEGVAALDLFAKHADSIAIVVSDVVMPGMTGPELVGRIRTHRPEIPVVFMSGHAPDSRSMPAADENLRFLRKPFAPHEIVSLVRDAIDHGIAQPSD